MLPRNEQKVAVFMVGIALAKSGPILIKHSQNLSAKCMGSVIVLPSDLNDEGRDDHDLFLRLFITSFSSFHGLLRSFFFCAFSSLVK